jgi:hypothetical protein
VGTDNAQDVLLEAERALIEGRFMLARKRAKKASKLIDRTQGLHRKFMKILGKMKDKVDDLESRGYDVSEAVGIINGAKSRAMKSDYRNAIERMKNVEPALDRAKYKPFPLLNRNVDIISDIWYENGVVNYRVRVENPSDEPLGELIITPFTPGDMFTRVPERPYGVIGGNEYKESVFELKPKVKNWSVGVDREVLTGKGVVLRTKLSSREGKASYIVTVENNSDQIIRDVSISPATPGGLESDPVEEHLEFVEPFGSATVEFNLTPGIIRDTDKKETNVVVLEEEEPVDEWEAVEVEELEDEEEFTFEDEGASEEEDYQGKDFNPVQPEYNLITMGGYSYPKSMKRRKKKRRKKKS